MHISYAPYVVYVSESYSKIISIQSWSRQSRSCSCT